MGISHFGVLSLGQRPRFHPLVRDDDGFDEARSVKVHAIDAHDAMIGIRLT
jgi:hypothetical protein